MTKPTALACCISLAALAGCVSGDAASPQGSGKCEGNMFVVRIAEIEVYPEWLEAYKAHLATPHFRAYKDGTPHMIKSLRLVPMQPLDPGHAEGIFKKWALK